MSLPRCLMPVTPSRAAEWFTASAVEPWHRWGPGKESQCGQHPSKLLGGFDTPVGTEGQRASSERGLLPNFRGLMEFAQLGFEVTLDLSLFSSFLFLPFGMGISILCQSYH